MTDIRGPDYELAEKDYMLGMKYKDIAENYSVSINTVKSWKQRYKWNRKAVHTKGTKIEKSMHTKKKGGQFGNSNAKGNTGNKITKIQERL